MLPQDTERLEPNAILNHLNLVITWYRDATSKVQAGVVPSDAIYASNAQSLGAEAVRLAFQSARAEASLIEANAKNNAPSSPQAPQTAQQQDYSQMAAKLSAQIDDTQTQLQTLNEKIATTAERSKRQGLIEQRDKLQGELSLDKAMQDAIQKLAAFAESATDNASEGSKGSINQLAKLVPEVVGNESEQKASPKPSSSPPAVAQSSGLLGQAITLLGQMRTMHEIDLMVDETSRLRETVERVRQPLRGALADTVKRGRDLANPSSAPGNGQAQATPQEFQVLIARFKQLSSATVPLSQEILTIEQSRSNFLEWRNSIERESVWTVRSLLTRIVLIALALAAVFVFAQMWRRLTFRYVRDARRRRQFLLLRRFVVGFLVCMVVLMGFVSEFSSLATFAGFVTAGIAVGLQAVLLSVAAYFFVMGRYGIRVGDRISVAGVTGDVIDIGLVRLYLMELAGTGIELYPTGRVVAFSNSVLFQAGTPLFKQIPGTEYAWHEVVISLAPGSNHKLLQEKVTRTVTSIYEQYRPAIESQLGNIEQRIEVQLKAPVPEAKLQFADTGLEFVVRYPVDIRLASEIDDRVTRAVLELLESEQELKTGVVGTPKIRAAIKG